MFYRLRFARDLWLDRLCAVFGVPLDCGARGAPEALSSRPSPHEALHFEVAGRPALLCYGRPAANGRTVFGDLLPFDELWRLGANEPTTLHLPFPATIAGVRVRRGKLSLYALPRPDAWTLILNRATRQWGITRPERGGDGRVYNSAYTSAVRSAELGRALLPTETIDHVERLTAHVHVVDQRTTHLVFDWETTRVTIPIAG